MNDAMYNRRMTALLERMGGLYTFADILDKIASGKMQSFSKGNTWAVTEIHDYPRRRVLDILFVVGDMDDLEDLYKTVIDFASSVDASLVRAHGRVGWVKFTKKYDWRVVEQVYYKDL